MLSFRQKIFLSYVIIFLIFVAFIYPVVSRLIDATQARDLNKQIKSLSAKLQDSSSLDAMVEKLNNLEKYYFFRITLLDPQKGVLYDSHAKLATKKQEEDLILQPEVKEALKKGSGYEVRFSPLFGQDMAYLAQTFDFQEKTLILRGAFPYGQIAEISKDFTLTFLIYSIILLLLFGLVMWLIFHLLTRPVKQIIAAILPYQQGKTDKIPEIPLSGKKEDEFTRLAATLNSLSQRVESHINALTQERNDKETILESLGEGVIAVDEDLTVHFVNHVAEDVLGIKRDKIIGKNFEKIRQPECLELIRSSKLNKMPMTAVISPRGKRKRYYDIIAVPRGIQEGVILVLQDKTSLHKVLELGRDFIANASHELKTPITIIRGFAETLHDHPELSQPVYLEITNKIVSNCQRMETLVKNLLTLAAIDEGLPRSRLQNCDLVDLALQSRGTILAVHPDADIVVEQIGEQPVIHLGDSDLLYQAILNLLDNAVKYSSHPAHVKVTLEKKEREVVIKISDKGVGIPHEDLERIFERFYAVDKSHSRALGGSGLGLSIVERIIEKHRGKINVASEVGKGTTFTIILPIHKEESPPSQNNDMVDF